MTPAWRSTTRAVASVFPEPMTLASSSAGPGRAGLRKVVDTEVGCARPVSARAARAVIADM